MEIVINVFSALLAAFLAAISEHGSNIVSKTER